MGEKNTRQTFTAANTLVWEHKTHTYTHTQTFLHSDKVLRRVQQCFYTNMTELSHCNTHRYTEAGLSLQKTSSDCVMHILNCQCWTTLLWFLSFCIFFFHGQLWMSGCTSTVKRQMIRYTTAKSNYLLSQLWLLSTWFRATLKLICYYCHLKQ